MWFEKKEYFLCSDNRTMVLRKASAKKLQAFLVDVDTQEQDGFVTFPCNLYLLSILQKRGYAHSQQIADEIMMQNDGEGQQG